MAKISRTSAAFAIGADLFTNPPGALPSAEVVTRRLGIEPSHLHDPGERYGPHAAPYKHGQWSLDRPLGEHADLESHLNWLLERLAPVRDDIAEILKSDGRL